MLTPTGPAALSDFSYMQQSAKDDGFTNLIMLKKDFFFSKNKIILFFFPFFFSLGVLRT